MGCMQIAHRGNPSPPLNKRGVALLFIISNGRNNPASGYDYILIHLNAYCNKNYFVRLAAT